MWARLVGYALGSALENHDEEGISSDPHFRGDNVFYLQAMATLPIIQNDIAVETCCSTPCATACWRAASRSFCRRSSKNGFRETAAVRLRRAVTLESEYDKAPARAAGPFAYLQTALQPSAELERGVAPASR